MKSRHLIIAYSLLILAFGNLYFLYTSNNFLQYEVLTISFLCFFTGHFSKLNKDWAIKLGFITSLLGVAVYGYSIFGNTNMNSYTLSLLFISCSTALLHFLPQKKTNS